jgi:hypothetical protein
MSGDANSRSNLAYAVKIVHATCCLAGSPSYVSEIETAIRDRGLLRAVRDHDTPALFDWFVDLLSFQGISDAVAAGYIGKYGSVRWSDIANAVGSWPACSKLNGYWRFDDCGYRKGAHTCSEPHHIGACPLPRHQLRNGRLNQMAYSLFFFMRDVADGDFVGWVDQHIAAVDLDSDDRVAAVRAAIVNPLRHVYGVADKTLAMALSLLLVGVGRKKPHWFEVGANLIAVDTLVHNFLWRTGILARMSAEHIYGPRCYQPDGCASILAHVANHIDAREFNDTFPATFPRFVQHAVWRYCAENGLDVCNGNRIADNAACGNGHCQLYRSCDRKPLRYAAALEVPVFQ